MSKINTQTVVGARGDHEFMEAILASIVVVAFIAVSLVAAAWLAGSGVALPTFGIEELGR